MSGGSIHLESEYGVGSVFSFKIPLKYDTKDVIIKVEEKTNDVCSLDKVILIAEDDTINFLLLKKILELRRYIVLRANNGQEAVTICEMKQNIDLVFMDIKMPILDGYQAFEIINKLNPSLPVIAHTSFTSIEDQEKIFTLGFTNYLAKPLDRLKVYEIVDAVFGN